MITFYKIFLPILILILPWNGASQLINARFSSSVYSWEKFDTVDVSKVIARGFQTLQFDISEGDVSLQSYLTGSMNLNESFADDGRIRVTNLFLKWKNIGSVADMSIGRIPFFAGVGNGIVDGALLRIKGMDEKITFVGYGGGNIRSDLVTWGFDGLEKNFLVGGQLIGVVTSHTRLGVSYINRNMRREDYQAIRPDSLFNPISIPVSPPSRAEQVVGFDARYSDNSFLTAYGRYDYDLNSKHSLRAQLSTRFEATNDLTFTGDYIYREPRIPFNSIFTIFPTSPVREYEGGAEYSVNSSIRLSGRFAYLHYTGDVGRRLTMGVATDYGTVQYSGANGYAGQLSSWSTQLMYPVSNRMIVPSIGFSFATYRQLEGEKRQGIFSGSIGVVVRPTIIFSVDIQVQWLRNPVTENDVRFFGKINYWFTHNLNLFKQERELE